MWVHILLNKCVDNLFRGSPTVQAVQSHTNTANLQHQRDDVRVTFLLPSLVSLPNILLVVEKIGKKGLTFE